MTAPEDVAYLLLLPDAVLSDQVTGLLAVVEANGFEVVSATLVHLDRTMMSAIYPTAMQDPVRWRPDAVQEVWDHLQTLYDAAPAIVVFVRGHARAAHELVRLKGYKRPESAGPGTLRCRGDAENVMLNLVHSPDTCADVLSESAVLLGAERARLHVAACREPRDGVLRQLLAPCDARYVPSRTARSSVSTPWILNDLRLRALQALAAAPAADHQQLLGARELVDAERDALEAAGSSVERLAVARGWTGRLEQAICGAAAMTWVEPVLRIGDLLRLATPKREVRHWLADLRRIGVHVSGVEEAVLGLHARAFRRGAALDEVWLATDPAPQVDPGERPWSPKAEAVAGSSMAPSSLR